MERQKICTGECGITCCEIDHWYIKEDYLSERFIELQLARGTKIYLWATENKTVEVLCVVKSICDHLVKNGCDLERYKRPYFCTHFPTEKHFFIPKDCVFYDYKKHYIIENLPEIKSVEDWVRLKSENYKEVIEYFFKESD